MQTALGQSRRGFLKSLVAVGATGLAGAIGIATRAEDTLVITSRNLGAWVTEAGEAVAAVDGPMIARLLGPEAVAAFTALAAQYINHHLQVSPVTATPQQKESLK